MNENKQNELWKNEFGKEYTERNTYTIEEFDEFYLKTWGITRSEMNKEFLDNISRDIKILEVGSNIGMQLRHLQKMGFKNLYGLEIQWYAIERSKEIVSNVNIIQGDALDIPFKDNFFDLVFTSGLLIHISPDNIYKVLNEIYRVTKKFIWGFEYYDDELKEIEYRGNKNCLWKRNFCNLYIETFPTLTLIKRKKYKYLNNDNVDEMFLLEKNS